MSIAESLFYAAQAAYSYRGNPISTWEAQDAGTKTAFATLAGALAALEPIDDVETAAAAIITPVGNAIPGGLSGTWASMTGMSRYNLVLIVEAYQRAVGE